MLSRALRILPLLPLLLSAQTAADPGALARKATDLLLSGKYAELEQMLTPEMQKDLPESTLAKIGNQIKTYGSVKSIGEAQPRKMGARTIVAIPVKFASQSVNYQWAVNAAGLMAGMVPLPGPVDWQRPAYSKPDSFKERDVTVGDGEWNCPARSQCPMAKARSPASCWYTARVPTTATKPWAPSESLRTLPKDWPRAAWWCCATKSGPSSITAR